MVKTQVVHTGGGDAAFALKDGPVDMGAYAYNLKKEGNDWFLDTQTRVMSRSARVVTALFNTPVTIMTAEEGSLRARMGELRYSRRAQACGSVVSAANMRYPRAQGPATRRTCKVSPWLPICRWAIANGR